MSADDREQQAKLDSARFVGGMSGGYVSTGIAIWSTPQWAAVHQFAEILIFFFGGVTALLALILTMSAYWRLERR